MVTDPIGDFLTRIRNAQARNYDEVVLPSTRMIADICKILKEEGFILNFEVIEKSPQNDLKVKLKYVNEIPAIRELVRVSKPGVRKYVGYRDIKPIMNGLGVAIYSTPNGVIKGEDAYKNKVGGEYICYIY